MKGKNPLVSVIIPAYNCSSYITEAIDSVIGQSYKDFEIIITDDGSVDNTKEILRPYLDSITYTYQDNRGPAAARNAGILKSKGEYIAFLDADDLWRSKKLEIQVKYLEENPSVGLVCSDAERFDNSGVLSGTKLGKMTVAERLTFEKLLYQNYIQTLTVIVKRECIDKIGLFDESEGSFFVEDYDLWLRIAMHYEIGYLNQPLAKYRFRPGSGSSNVIRTRKAVLGLLDKISESQPEIKQLYKCIIRKSKANLFYEMGYDCFSRNEILEARKYFIISLKHNSIAIKTYRYLFFSLLPQMLVAGFKKIKHKIEAWACA